MQKTYYAKLDREITAEHAAIIQSGLKVKGETYLPAKVEILNDQGIILSIVEGKNRQIRRMCEFLGYKVEVLTRLKIGELGLENLKPGEYRYLTDEEVKSLNGGRN